MSVDESMNEAYYNLGKPIIKESTIQWMRQGLISGIKR